MNNSGEWTSVLDALPKNSEYAANYLVVVWRYYSFSVNALNDTPFEEKFVTTAYYHSEQKIWCTAHDSVINALIPPEDSGSDSEYISHWMPFPEPPKEDGEQK